MGVLVREPCCFRVASAIPRRSFQLEHHLLDPAAERERRLVAKGDGRSRFHADVRPLGPEKRFMKMSRWFQFASYIRSTSGGVHRPSRTSLLGEYSRSISVNGSRRTCS